MSEKGAMVLLLTATPYTKDVSDLNNQLILLPHTSKPSYRMANGQMVFPGMVDEEVAPESWKVSDGDHFFKEFMALPVATVISTSQVAKNFAATDEEGNEFLRFGEQKRYFPRIGISRVKPSMFLEQEMCEALESGTFIHKAKSFRDRYQNWRRSKDIIHHQAQVSWASSPEALEEVVLQSSQDGSYKVQFIKPLERRLQILSPILTKIRVEKGKNDPKLQALVRLLTVCRREGRKVIVFSERLPTVWYLEEEISRELPAMRLASVVKKEGSEYALKDFDEEVFPMIKGFAPQANKDKISEGETHPDYHVFLATDAYSTGVNLQDASVVINYDLAWTPDVLIQRAGRILRLWEKPRRVQFVVFVAEFSSSHRFQKATTRIEDRLTNLIDRSKRAEQFSELPLLTVEDQREYTSLGELSKVPMEDLGLADPARLEEFTGASPFLRHITNLKNHEEYARAIPNDISSARQYPEEVDLLFLLLRHEGEYVPVVYRPDTGALMTLKEDELLDLLECDPATSLATVSPDQLESLAQQAKLAWESAEGLQPDQGVERICALWLIGQNTQVSMLA